MRVNTSAFSFSGYDAKIVPIKVADTKADVLHINVTLSDSRTMCVVKLTTTPMTSERLTNATILSIPNIVKISVAYRTV